VSILILFVFCNNLFGNPTFVRNTLKEINACEGEIKLKLVRIWGDDNVDDENQFFRMPCDIKIGKNGLVYIVDSSNNRIQVFSRDGSYKKTIGRKGQGPSDTIQPRAVAIDSDSHCVIADYGNYRIQTIDSNGNYLSSFKTVEKSFISRYLIDFYNSRGEIIKPLGKVYDNARSLVNFESIFFTLDKDDNVFIAYCATPLYCKYSNNGDLLMLVTYDVPYKSPTVEFNKSNNELLIEGEKKSMISAGISTGQEGLVYTAIATRPKNKEEIFFLTGETGNVRRYPRNIGSEKTDRFRLLVFNPSGKVIAAKQLNVFCDKIYVHEDTLFIIDSYMGMKIHEYEISLI